MIVPKSGCSSSFKYCIGNKGLGFSIRHFACLMVKLIKAVEDPFISNKIACS